MTGSSARSGGGSSGEITHPAPGGAALLVIDMLNDLSFDDARPLRPAAQHVAATIRDLRDEADRCAVPVIYVNDNGDRWHSDRERLIDEVAAARPEAAAIVERLRPADQHFFVIKPRFSGFYATNLQVLLPRLRASRLILTGIAADICVLFTAADAHMREYDLWVPEDAVASLAPERTRWALDIMRETMGAETRATDTLALDEWIARADA